MSKKQKTAIVALVLSAIVGASAALAPGMHCSPPPAEVIGDALGDESGPAAPKPDAGSSSSSSSSGDK